MFVYIFMRANIHRDRHTRTHTHTHTHTPQVEEDEEDEWDPNLIGAIFFAPGFGALAQRALGHASLVGQLKRPLTIGSSQSGSSKIQVTVEAAHPREPVVLDCLTPAVLRVGGGGCVGGCVRASCVDWWVRGCVCI